MKFIILILIGLGFGVYGGLEAKAQTAAGTKISVDTITVTGTRFLFPLLERWAVEYRKVHPTVYIRIEAALKNPDINASAAPFDPVKLSADLEYTKVAQFVLLPILNENHPKLDSLLERGVNEKSVQEIYFKKPKENENLPGMSWNEWRVYSRGACASAAFASKFGKKIGDLENTTGQKLDDDVVVLQRVQSDSLGIAYNNPGFIYDRNTRQLVRGIRVIPYDINGNERVDSEENFYQDLDQLLTHLEQQNGGLPPREHVTLIYKKEAKDHLRAFIAWISAEGQQYNHSAAFLKK